MSSSSHTSTSKEWCLTLERTLSRTLMKKSYQTTLGLLPLTDKRVRQTGRVKMHFRVKTTGELITTMIISKICLEHLSVRNHSSNLKKRLTNILLRRASMLDFTHFILTQWVETLVSTIPCIRMDSSLVTLSRRWSSRCTDLQLLSSTTTCNKPIRLVKRRPILTKLHQRPPILTKLWCLQAWAKVKPLKDRNLRE